MNKIDQQKAARVWQRVQESKPAAKPARMEDLQELILQAETMAAVYQQLARQLPKEAPLLQRLSREKQHQRNVLRGIHELTFGEKCQAHGPQIPKEPPERALSRLYGQSLRTLKAYEEKCNDLEYGPGFRVLADQEREHGVALLGIIGNLGMK